MNNKPFRIETVRHKGRKIEIWEQSEDARMVVVLHENKKTIDTQSFDTLSGARSWAYFKLLKLDGAKRI